jgi:hypothetical protein
MATPNEVVERFGTEKLSNFSRETWNVRLETGQSRYRVSFVNGDVTIYILLPTNAIVSFLDVFWILIRVLNECSTEGSTRATNCIVDDLHVTVDKQALLDRNVVEKSTETLYDACF